LVLAGSRCQVGDSSPGEIEVAIRDWQMQRSTDGVTFSGSLHWEQNGFWERQGLCTGTRQGGIAGDLQILEFRRAN
jgi:hypothetical protein